MKKLSYLFLILAGIIFTVISCSDDEEPAVNSVPPTLTVTPGSTGVAAGETVTFTVSASPRTGATSVTVTADGQTVSGGSYDYTVDGAATEGTEITITFTATDDNTPPLSTSFDATITVGKKTVDVTDPTVTDATFAANTVYNLDASVEYLFDGLVYVEEGSVLNIPAGTLIKFKKTPTSSDATSSLIITRGAQIIAEGTSDDPIILTAEDDDGSLAPADNQQWAGLILLGNAPAEKDGATELQIEGIDSGEPRGLYGGSDPADNSGVLKYVSIRFTGFALNGVAGDEIQGLTLGGIGNGTTIDYIDIFSSADDGVEIFGGTVNIKHISVAFATDDDFDFDLGWTGHGQFLFALMGDETVGYDHSGEWDGADPDDATLFSAPNIYNATFIGPGTTASGRDKAILMRENFAGKLGNSILEGFPGVGIEVQDLGDGSGDLPNDSYERLTVERDGYQVEITNNTWANFAGATDLNSLVKASSGDGGYVGQTTDVEAELADNNNKFSATGILTSVSRNADGGLDPRPLTEDTEVATVPAGLDQVDYRGAFSASENWLGGWSSLSQLGYMPSN
ncbi:MAG: hypothetical protein DHS20C17_00210 [Cyclobacteriaceae bacterium]|nr:MAG: hypothetical protein DHS20C17_00210 [Cyclobacteriaceae bacterium]